MVKGRTKVICRENQQRRQQWRTPFRSSEFLGQSSDLLRVLIKKFIRILKKKHGKLEIWETPFICYLKVIWLQNGVRIRVDTLPVIEKERSLVWTTAWKSFDSRSKHPFFKAIFSCQNSQKVFWFSFHSIMKYFILDHESYLLNFGPSYF